MTHAEELQVNWECIMDYVYEDLNQSHEDCELDVFYIMLHDLNELDHAYQ